MAQRRKVGEAYVEVGADLGKLEAGLKKGKKSTAEASKDMQSSATKLGAVIGGVMAGAAVAVGAFVVKSVREFAALDQALDRNARTLQTLGYTYKEGRKAAESYADSIESLTEFSDGEALGSFNSLLRITRDVNASMQLNALAMDKVARDGGNLNEVAEMLALAYQGNQRGLAGMARELGIVGEKAKDSSFLFKTMEDRYKGAAQQTTSLTGELKKLGNDLGNIAEKAGAAIAPVVTELSRKLRASLGNEDAKLEDRILLLTKRLKDLKKIASAPSGETLIERYAMGDVISQAGDLYEAIKQTESQLSVAQSNRAGSRAAIAPGGALQPKPAEQTVEELEAIQKKKREIFEQDQKAGQEAADAQINFMNLQLQVADNFVGPMSSSMETFFDQMIDGYKSLADVGEAIAKSIAKSFIGMYAQVLEQQAAMAFAEAMGSSLNPFTAFASPGMFARAALLATAAGGLRAVAANMADGGLVKSRPGGTVVRLGERGEDEAVVPARMMGGFGGGVKVGTVALNYYGVKDARDAMSNGRAEQAGHQILTRLDEEQRRQGVGKKRGGK